jgi:predicted amidohydrolase
VGGDVAARQLLEGLPAGQLQQGGSAIIGPGASVLARAGAQEEVLCVDLDMARLREELAALDTDGHYARPDVFELRVDRRPKLGVRFDGDDGG